jgi:hypothetical protein
MRYLWMGLLGREKYCQAIINVEIVWFNYIVIV